MHPPASHLLAYFLRRLVAYCRTETDKVAPPPALRKPGTEGKSQEVELLLWVDALPAAILAVDNPRLFWVQLQATLPEALFKGNS